MKRKTLNKRGNTMSENKSIISKSKSGRVNKTIFTEDMKKDYTILVPDMLPIHFNLIISLYKSYGIT